MPPREGRARILFLGGSGNISPAFSWLAAERGIEPVQLNRGLSRVALPQGVHNTRGDVGDGRSMEHAPVGQDLDVVVN